MSKRKRVIYLEFSHTVKKKLSSCVYIALNFEAKGLSLHDYCTFCKWIHSPPTQDHLQVDLTQSIENCNTRYCLLTAWPLHHACYLVQWGATYQNSRCVLNKSANDDWKLQLDMTQTSQFFWEITYRLTAWHGPFSCIFLAWKPSK